MQDYNSIFILLAVNFKLSSNICNSNKVEMKKMSRVPYTLVMKSLMLTIICTRPDISQATRAISRYMTNPSKKRWKLREEL